jgi:hypothetical protein
MYANPVKTIAAGTDPELVEALRCSWWESVTDRDGTTENGIGF